MNLKVGNLLYNNCSKNVLKVIDMSDEDTITAKIIHQKYPDKFKDEPVYISKIMLWQTYTKVTKQETIKRILTDE